MPRLTWFLIAGSLVALSSARAQTAGPAAFGAEAQQLQIPASAFVPVTSEFLYTLGFGSEIRPTSDGTQAWVAPLGLPSGALLDEIRLLVRDEDAKLDISGSLFFHAQSVSDPAGCGGHFVYSEWTGDSAGLDGRGIVTLMDSDSLLIEGQSMIPCGQPAYHLHGIEVQLNSTSHRLMGAVVVWRRSVSGAPEVATFNDVPLNHPFFQFVEALAAAGITAGCGGGSFCPDAPLTRGQMAVFLAKALGLHSPL